MELVVVVAILGILITLFAPELGELRKRAGRVVCAGHLRSLHCSFGAYLNDNESWPQCPDDLSNSDEEQFWIDAVKDYGAPESVWKCPSLTQRLGNDTSDDAHKIHYTPTEFDDNPMTPRKWALQPWLIEISAAHGGSNLLVRTDGAVQSVTEALNEAKGTN